jgi:hypothetical protein
VLVVSEPASAAAPGVYSYVAEPVTASVSTPASALIDKASTPVSVIGSAEPTSTVPAARSTVIVSAAAVPSTCSVSPVLPVGLPPVTVTSVVKPAIGVTVKSSSPARPCRFTEAKSV